jgi:hypothetical protein
MDLFVLAQELGSVAARLELGHLLREHWEDVLLLNSMVCAKVRAELNAGVDELLE